VGSMGKGQGHGEASEAGGISVFKQFLCVFFVAFSAVQPLQKSHLNYENAS